MEVDTCLHAQLDPMQYTTVQLGEQQVFDVELDRHTELQPVRDDVRAVSWDGVQIERVPSKPDIEQEQEQEQEQEPGERIWDLYLQIGGMDV